MDGGLAFATGASDGDAGNMSWAIGGTDASSIKMTLSGQGLGIGTTTPQSQLQIAGGASGDGWGSNGRAFSVRGAEYVDTAGVGTMPIASVGSFGVPTFSAANGRSIANAATLYIEGAPLPGGNVSIAHPYALYVGSGDAHIGGSIDAANLSGNNTGDMSINLAGANGLSVSGQSLSLSVADAQSSGALSSADWNNFNGKQSFIAPASSNASAQYYRGDKTWQPLSTSVVPEGSNLYFSTARFNT